MCNVTDFAVLSDFGWVTDETAVQLAAEKVDQHLKLGNLDGLGNNAAIDSCMALSE